MMYKVWIEWDLGQDGRVFSTEDKAKEWLKKTIEDDEYLMQEEGWETGLDILDDGLASIEELYVD